MFLRQADGRKSPLPKPWSTDKRSNHHNQRRFNRRQSIPALLPCPDPRIIPYVQDSRPAARHIVRTAVSVRPNLTLRPARKPFRHTCGKLHECLSFYYLSPNCAAPFKSMPKLMPSCTSPNRQLTFRQNASAETFRNNIVRSPANAITLHIGMQNAYGNHSALLRASGCAQLLASTSMGVSCIQSVILRSRAHRNQEVIRPRRALSKWPRCLLL